MNSDEKVMFLLGQGIGHETIVEREYSSNREVIFEFLSYSPIQSLIKYTEVFPDATTGETIRHTSTILISCIDIEEHLFMLSKPNPEDKRGSHQKCFTFHLENNTKFQNDCVSSYIRCSYIVMRIAKKMAEDLVSLLDDLQ